MLVMVGKEESIAERKVRPGPIPRQSPGLGLSPKRGWRRVVSFALMSRSMAPAPMPR